MAISKDSKHKLIKTYASDIKNTGKSEVQIAILTKDIQNLTEHFKKNKKDLHSKRGFLAKIQKRKDLLAYLKRQNVERYTKILKELNLRK